MDFEFLIEKSWNSSCSRSAECKTGYCHSESFLCNCPAYSEIDVQTDECMARKGNDERFSCCLYCWWWFHVKRLFHQQGDPQMSIQFLPFNLGSFCCRITDGERKSSKMADTPPFNIFSSYHNSDCNCVRCQTKGIYMFHVRFSIVT
jgi:hypothetical protein